MNTLRRRLTSVVLAIAMLVTMFSFGSLMASAAATTTAIGDVDLKLDGVTLAVSDDTTNTKFEMNETIWDATNKVITPTVFQITPTAKNNKSDPEDDDVVPDDLTTFTVTVTSNNAKVVTAPATAVTINATATPPVTSFDLSVVGPGKATVTVVFTSGQLTAKTVTIDVEFIMSNQDRVEADLKYLATVGVIGTGNPAAIVVPANAFRNFATAEQAAIKAIRSNAQTQLNNSLPYGSTLTIGGQMMDMSATPNPTPIPQTIPEAATMVERLAMTDKAEYAYEIEEEGTITLTPSLSATDYTYDVASSETSIATAVWNSTNNVIIITGVEAKTTGNPITVTVKATPTDTTKETVTVTVKVTVIKPTGIRVNFTNYTTQITVNVVNAKDDPDDEYEADPVTLSSAVILRNLGTVLDTRVVSRDIPAVSNTTSAEAPSGFGTASINANNTSVNVAQASISLGTERVKLPDNFEVKSFSIDGGLRWRNGTPWRGRNAVVGDISRLLNREMTLLVSNKEIDKETRLPKYEVGKAAVTANPTATPPVVASPAVEGTVIIAFPKTEARPKPTRLFVNYNLGANFANNATVATSYNGRWSFADEKGATAVSAQIANIQITIPSADNARMPDATRWSTILNQATGETGAAVFEFSAVRAESRATYFVRMAPSIDGDKLTPATRFRRITVLGQQKAPSAPRIRNNGFNVRANSSVQIGTAAPVVYSDKTTLTNVTAAPNTIQVWNNATDRRPASQPARASAR